MPKITMPEPSSFVNKTVDKLFPTMPYTLPLYTIEGGCE